uniref:Uncharacterized protein n=1 Tax=Leersia perrieri TaxID=77586 RepID=A0A0D9XZ84_9ORYZ
MADTRIINDVHEPAAVAYVKLIMKELTNSMDTEHHLLHLFRRRRPHGIVFPAAVAAALDDLADLFSEGSILMAGRTRHEMRMERAEKEAMLMVAMSQRQSIDARIRDIDAEIVAMTKRLEEARAPIRQTLRLLPFDADGEDAEETARRVVSLVENLGRAQRKEAALMADIVMMRADYERLQRRREDVMVAGRTAITALEDVPELPRATEKEDYLMHEAVPSRFEDDVAVLVKFTGWAFDFVKPC